MVFYAMVRRFNSLIVGGDFGNCLGVVWCCVFCVGYIVNSFRFAFGELKFVGFDLCLTFLLL